MKEKQIINIHSENRNSLVLKDFIKYCKEHPNERFWQALTNWTGKVVVFADNLTDPFYWEGKNK